MFYKTGVDIANTKSMWEFLNNHYKYYTMNSLNRQKSIANNVKLYNLNLEGDWTVAMRYLFDETDSGCLQYEIEAMIREFEEENPYYKVFFNGRSSGYLVLGSADNSDYSVLPEFITDYDTYEEFKKDIKYGWQTGNVSDFNRELRELVEIVREFDRLCDSLRDLVNDFSKRSYDSDRLIIAVDTFNEIYGNDLDLLDLEGPEFVEDRVKLNCLEDYKAFMHCFLECLGEDRKRATANKGYLWLKEE